LSGHPQYIGGAVEHGPGSVVEHVSPTDAVVRAQSQPGGEMLLAGPPVHVEPNLRRIFPCLLCGFSPLSV